MKKTKNIITRKSGITLYMDFIKKKYISPHPLLLIGSKTIEKIKENCICISDMTRTNRKPKMNSNG